MILNISVSESRKLSVAVGWKYCFSNRSVSTKSLLYRPRILVRSITEISISTTDINVNDTFLFRYVKEGGEKLVKCYASNITRNKTEDFMHCPNPDCNIEFAGETYYHGRKAYKIIQGKVVIK